MIKKSYASVMWAPLFLGLFLLSTAMSWYSLAAANFLYGVWHDYAGVAEHIGKYAPENRYKHGFENTTKQQRATMFKQIVVAVHNDGEDLEKIFYGGATEDVAIPLLNEEEIVHLKDVARLVSIINPMAWVGMLLLISSLFVLHYGQVSFPGIKKILVNILILVTLAVVFVLVWGAKDFFYQLHIWIFPAEHKWFFYYQESLMSTMMMAPHMFAYIAVVWLVLCFGFISAALVLVVKVWPWTKS